METKPVFEPIPAPRFTHRMELTIDDKVAEAFARENFEEFFEYLYTAYPEVLRSFLDHEGDLVMDFLRGDEF